jgi:hypothetical protein
MENGNILKSVEIVLAGKRKRCILPFSDYANKLFRGAERRIHLWIIRWDYLRDSLTRFWGMSRTFMGMGSRR